MTEERDWREGKPKWLVDAAKADMAELERIAALRWPMEAKPKPDFSVFGYGRQSDNAKQVQEEAIERADNGIATVYCVHEHREASSRPVRIRKAPEDSGRYPGALQYSNYSVDNFTSSPGGAPYFLSEKDANLFALWTRCEYAAKDLATSWRIYQQTKK